MIGPTLRSDIEVFSHADMQSGQPSHTAIAAGYARAYHQNTEGPRVFTDPLAGALVGNTGDDAQNGLASAFVGRAEDHMPDDTAAMITSARARLAEDTIADAVAGGTRQAVILGAGLDTFAYRNPHPDLHVFEVDHPDTQAWKRQRLTEADITSPDSLTFVPVDFEKQTLATGLAASNFVRDEPTIFIWLGVTMYLTTEAIRTTLNFIAEQARPVQVVADYMSPISTAAPENRAAFEKAADLIAELGEPFLSYFTVDEFENELRAAGFDVIEDFSAPDLLVEYVGRRGAPDGVVGGGLASAHVVRASAGPRHKPR